MHYCEICKKTHNIKTNRKLLRGHYNPTGKTKQKVNLVKIKLPDKSKRSTVCTKCLKKSSKNTPK